MTNNIKFIIMSTEKSKNNILWAKGIWNGVLAWIIGIIAYMIPAFVVAMKMGFELGPKSDDPGAVSAEISQSISGMYQNNQLLSYGLIVVISLLIFWRARVVIKKSSNNIIVNGLLVTIFPVLFSIVTSFSSGFKFTSIIEIILYIAAGYAAGYLGTKSAEKTTESD